MKKDDSTKTQDALNNKDDTLVFYNLNLIFRKNNKKLNKGLFKNSNNKKRNYYSKIKKKNQSLMILEIKQFKKKQKLKRLKKLLNKQLKFKILEILEIRL